MSILRPGRRLGIPFPPVFGAHPSFLRNRSRGICGDVAATRRAGGQLPGGGTKQRMNPFGVRQRIGPSIWILATQHDVIRHREPAGIIGIVGEDQDLPMALFHPRLVRHAVMHRAARLAIRSGGRAIPHCQRIRTLMRCGEPGRKHDADADRALHAPIARAAICRATRLPCASRYRCH